MAAGLSNESQILREKSRTFCGSFKVPLSKLKLEESPNNPRQFDPKNAANILERFCLVKCNRLEPEHYVSALISKPDLPQSFQNPGKRFEEPHDFDPPQALLCFDGEHRLEAANRFLAGDDRWWVADLYSDDISERAKTALREQSPRSASYLDGDIYRQIRIAALDNKTSSDEKSARRNKWLARLSSAEKRRNVSRMESSSVMREVRDGLDALIPFTGLWHPLEIGHFKRLLDIHCPEEMTRYLCRIKQTWNYIIGNREDHQNKLDAATVEVLQGRCPFRSLEDRAYIEARFLKGDIFPVIPSSDFQTMLLERIMSIEHIIPSLHTFLEETKWLEPGAAILKGILPTRYIGSLAQAFRALHNGQTRLKEQMSAFSYRYKDLPNGSETEWFSYRQLWLIPLRHFPTPKKDCAKWRVKKVTGKRKRDREWQELETFKNIGSGFQEQWLHQLTSLASANGYQQIKYARSADADTAKDFLLKARPPKYYHLDGNRLRQKIQLLCQMLGDIEEVQTHTQCPEVTSDYDNCGSDIEDRCGRPQEHSVKKDEENLFLGFIYPESLAITPKKYITSFACKRDSFHFFFGMPGEGTTPLQTYKDTSTRNLDGSSGQVDDIHGNADLPRIDPQERDRSTVPIDPLSSDETESDPSRSALHLTLQENGVQLADIHNHSPTHLCHTGEDQGQVVRQSPHQATVPAIKASELLLKKAGDQFFTVYSPTEDSFRTRHADPHDKTAVVAALRLASDSHFMANASGQRLKLTDPGTIVEQAYSGHLKSVLSLPRHGVQEIIRRFESDSQSRRSG